MEESKKSLDRDPQILLHDVARLLRTRFDQRARAQGMTRAQWVILARLERQPGLSQNEMASLCEVEPISVARLVDRLEARGLLERRHDPNDRRIWRLHLLPAAKPFLEEIAGYREAMDDLLMGDLSPAQHKALVDILASFKNKLTADADTPLRLASGE